MKHTIGKYNSIPPKISFREHLELGRLHYQNSCQSKAYYHYLQALEQNPKLPDLHYKLAIILYEWHEWDLAADHYLAVISAKPDCDAKVYFNLGLVSHQQGRYGLAMACYQQAIAARPDYLIAHLNLGSLVQQQSYGEAILLYQKLLAQFPKSAMLHNKLGYALQQQQDFAAALEQYQKALHLDPTLSQVHHNLGHLWLRQEDRLRATEHYREAARLSPSTKIWGDLAAVLLSQGKVIDALATLREAIANLSHLIAAYCQNALANGANNHLSQARRACARFLQSLQSPPSAESNSVAQDWLFQVYFHSGEIAYESLSFSRAETRYHQALALRPQTSALYPKLHNCLIQQGRMAAAAMIAPGQPSQAPTESTQISLASRCGVTCQNCMGKLIQEFCPTQLAKGVFRIAVDRAPAFPSPEPEVKQLSQGSAWVTPRESEWAACREIIVSNSEGQLLPEMSRAYPWRLPNCPEESQPALNGSASRPAIKLLKGKVLLLSTLSGHIYYHWMIDLLPRVSILQQQGISLDQIDWFIVNSLDFPFQQETLTQLGIPLHKVLESDRVPHIQADQLIVPSFPGHLDWIPPKTIEFLRSQFSPKQKSDASTSDAGQKKHKRLYISRQNASYRNVLNEAEVESILAEFGFTTVFLETLTVLEQALCFAEADVIVSPHGSGLTNLVFCKPDTVVIEIFAPRYLRTDYWMVSQHLKLRHYYMLGQEVACLPLRDLMYQSPLTEDIYVEVSSLRSALRVAEVGQTAEIER